MKPQGVINVPVENGKALKSKVSRQDNSSGADFIAVMNDLAKDLKGSKDTASESRADRTSGDNGRTSYKKEDLKLSVSYNKRSDPSLIKQTDKSAPTDTRTKDKDISTEQTSVRTKDDKRSDKGKEIKDQDKKTDIKKPADKDKDTGISGPETEDITVDEDKATDDFTSNILTTIEKDTGSSEQSVKDAMEKLGLTVTDLFNPSNAAKLYMNLTGQDTSDILTSDDFSTFLDDLSQALSDLPAEMAGVAEMTSDIASDDPSMSFATPSANDSMSGTDSSADMVNVKVVNAVTVEETSSDDKAVTTEAATDTDGTASDTIVKQNENISQGTDKGKSPDQYQGNPSETEGNPSMSDKGGGAAKTTETENVTLTQNTVSSQTVRSFTETITSALKYTDINADNLIQQIAEKVKEAKGAAVKSLEMELNPASLGKIFLQVSEKSGDVSAHLYAQNEAVRHALQNRLSDLREELNKQGVRVNEVTISVEPHAFTDEGADFGQSLSDQGGNYKGRRGEHMSGSLSGSAFSDTDSIEETREEILHSMMKDNGNTLSYLA
ncbi:MAG: flagellar hook-length control protein FliK [Lachnospiraceae bacterium]|nr:flagellar hook-length control protein FliK [Lachnospiraceae bacterium]